MTRYNKYKKQLVDLNDGEEWCPKCKGKGLIKHQGGPRLLRKGLICSECFGDGKIDWIEKATGKKPRVGGHSKVLIGPGR